MGNAEFEKGKAGVRLFEVRGWRQRKKGICGPDLEIGVELSSFRSQLE